MQFLVELIFQLAFEALAWTLHDAWEERRDRGRERLRARAATRRNKRYE
jgi:hypothetical protein